MWWLNTRIFCKMLTTIMLVNTALTSCNPHFVLVMMRTFKVYSLSNFQVYSAVLLTIVTTLYMRSSELSCLVIENWYPLTHISFLPLLGPWQPPIHSVPMSWVFLAFMCKWHICLSLYDLLCLEVGYHGGQSDFTSRQTWHIEHFKLKVVETANAGRVSDLPLLPWSRSQDPHGIGTLSIPRGEACPYPQSWMHPENNPNEKALLSFPQFATCTSHSCLTMFSPQLSTLHQT